MEDWIDVKDVRAIILAYCGLGGNKYYPFPVMAKLLKCSIRWTPADIEEAAKDRHFARRNSKDKLFRTSILDVEFIKSVAPHIGIKHTLLTSVLDYVCKTGDARALSIFIDTDCNTSYRDCFCLLADPRYMVALINNGHYDVLRAIVDHEHQSHPPPTVVDTYSFAILYSTGITHTIVGVRESKQPRDVQENMLSVFIDGFLNVSMRYWLCNESKPLVCQTDCTHVSCAYLVKRFPRACGNKHYKPVVMYDPFAYEPSSPNYS